jgi:hypothetical protein
MHCLVHRLGARGSATVRPCLVVHRTVTVHCPMCTGHELYTVWCAHTAFLKNPSAPGPHPGSHFPQRAVSALCLWHPLGAALLLTVGDHRPTSCSSLCPCSSSPSPLVRSLPPLIPLSLSLSLCQVFLISHSHRFEKSSNLCEIHESMCE